MQDLYGQVTANYVIHSQLLLLFNRSFLLKVVSRSKEMTVNAELLELIELVKTSPKPVQEVVEDYFSEIVFSVLKQEWLQMQPAERQMLIAKLTHERKKR